MSTRREFLGRSTAGVAAFGAVSLPLDLLQLARSPTSPGEGSEAGALQQDWNTSWPDRITGRRKAVFDVAEIESGFGVWRAHAWVNQYQQVLKIPRPEMSPVVVIRHNAIILAMQQSFWERYGIAKLKGVTHPLTGEPIDRNPALIDEKDGVPAPFSQAGLHKQIARGISVLACNLALQDLVELVKNADKSSEDAARKIALDALVPGVILQPSGVFAVILAQEAGCAYIKAS